MVGPSEHDAKVVAQQAQQLILPIDLTLLLRRTAALAPHPAGRRRGTGSRQAQLVGWAPLTCPAEIANPVSCSAIHPPLLIAAHTPELVVENGHAPRGRLARHHQVLAEVRLRVALNVVVGLHRAGQGAWRWAASDSTAGQLVRCGEGWLRYFAAEHTLHPHHNPCHNVATKPRRLTSAKSWARNSSSLKKYRSRQVPSEERCCR